MLLKAFSIALVTVLLASSVSGNANPTFGSGNSACSSLTPGHPGSAQTGASPYAVDVSATSFTESGGLTVTLSKNSASDPDFKGFLVQARRVDSPDTVVGSFTAVTRSKLNCGGSGTITHDSSADKPSMTFTWTAPSTGVGNVQFRATFVQDQPTYWVSVRSAIITGPAATGPAPTPAPTTPPPVGGGGQDSNVDLTTCGQSKSCYRTPADCTTDCDVIFTWVKNGNNVDIEIEGTVSGSQGYVAVAFSQDQSMGDDSVIDCIIPSGSTTGTIQMSYNPGESNVQLSDGSAGIVSGSESGSRVNNVLYCRLTRVISPTITGADSGKVFDLNANYYLLVAKGGASGSVMFQHDSGSAGRFSSSSQVNLGSGDIVSIGGSGQIQPLVLVHGVFMVLAWMVSASVAILLPRYYKDAWPGKKLGGKPIWFQLHQALMFLALFCTVIGFIVIFVYADGYSGFADLPQKAHPPLGIITTILCIANPIMAAFRCNPGTKNRPIFNWAHFAVGEGAHIFAAVSIVLSAFLFNPTGGSMLIIAIVFIVWHIVVEITLTVLRCMHKREGPTDDVAMSNAANPQGSPAEEPAKPEPQPSTVRTAILIVYAVGVVVLAIALLVTTSLS